MKVVSIVGARPQFIKAAAVSRAFSGLSGIREIIVHTGQHFDAGMSDVFFDELEIPRPDYNLGVAGFSHGAMTGRMLEGIEKLLLDERPDTLLVYGDTNSTLAGALAAAKVHIPVAHVEAGLRSFNRKMPEEVNRVLTDHISAILFAPTSTAVENLQNEGIQREKVFQVGDVMLDVANFYGARVGDSLPNCVLSSMSPGAFCLLTLHRAENIDSKDRMNEIITALESLNIELPVVLPLHPRTRKRLDSFGLMARLGGVVHVIEPVGYLDMIALERNSRVILTDSGGVQKEAFFHGVPCVTIRDQTEWLELVETGWNRLANPDSADDIRNKVLAALESEPVTGAELYGKGDAAQRIAAQLVQG